MKDLVIDEGLGHTNYRVPSFLVLVLFFSGGFRQSFSANAYARTAMPTKQQDLCSFETTLARCAA